MNINIDYNDKIKLLEIIEKDAQFLCDNNIMDYSLLFAIENVGKDNEDKYHKNF